MSESEGAATQPVPAAPRCAGMARFVETTYANPLIAEPWADPALAGPDGDGWYWCYATDDEHEPLPARRFKVARSRDLVRWETHPPGAEAGAIRDPIPNAGRHRACWAPDIRRFGPRDWVLYGSLKFDDHAEGEGQGHGIFAAHAAGPLGFDTPLVLARGRGFTTIDPCHLHDPASGRSFLYWGSADAGILGRELQAVAWASRPAPSRGRCWPPTPLTPSGTCGKACMSSRSRGPAARSCWSPASAPGRAPTASMPSRAGRIRSIPRASPAGCCCGRTRSGTAAARSSCSATPSARTGCSTTPSAATP
jgi:hypothetical protein